MHRALLIFVLLVSGCGTDLDYASGHQEALAGEWSGTFEMYSFEGSSNFVAHWSHHDIAAYIFSYQVSPNLDGASALKLVKPLEAGFRKCQSGKNFVAFRRPSTHSDPEGFDEVRYTYVASAHRIYVLYANLDTEKEYFDSLLEMQELVVNENT